MQTNIIQTTPTGAKVLIEEHQTNTDAFGIFSIMVGDGLRVGGSATGIGSIDWSKGPYYLNLKIAITPVGAGLAWNYTKEWVELGTTIFGTVPYALFSANTAKLDEKLNSSDTTKMLGVYAKVIQVENLSSALDTKLSSKDTLAMLAPYAKLAFTVDSIYLKKQLASKLDISDSIKFTKQNYTDSALLTKSNITEISNLTKKSFTDSALLTKLTSTGSAADLTNFPILNQNTTGNAATATYAGNITATSNTTLASLPNLNTVGTITNGVWNGNTIDIAHGGTGLNTSGTSGQILITTESGTLTWTNSSTLTGAHYIGESYGGGIVFYVYENGKHGLIVSSTDQSTGVYWSKSASYTTTNAVRDGVNAGMTNTERIILSQGTGNYAAQVAANYKGGGFGDWYLPSITELNLLYAQRQLMFSIGYSNTYYWSSNENPSNITQAWAYNFTGSGYFGLKYYNSVSVRAIRSF